IRSNHEFTRIDTNQKRRTTDYTDYTDSTLGSRQHLNIRDIRRSLVLLSSVHSCLFVIRMIAAWNEKKSFCFATFFCPHLTLDLYSRCSTLSSRSCFGTLRFHGRRICLRSTRKNSADWFCCSSSSYVS